MLVTEGRIQKLSAQMRRTTKALQRIGRVISGLAIGLSVCMVGGSKAQAASFNFTKVVDTKTPRPGSTGNFGSFDAPSLENGSVAFRSGGIYTTVGGSLNLVVDTNTFIPGNGTRKFGFNLIAPSLSNGSVAFYGDSGSYEPGNPPFIAAGIYTNVGGTLNVVADNNTPIPGGTGNFYNFSSLASLNNGSVAFEGKRYPGFSGGPFISGIYTNIGGSLNVVADGNTPVPDGTENFAYLNYPSLDNGSVAFIGYQTPISALRQGIYTNLGGSLNVVADYNTPIPGGTGNFDNFNFSRNPPVLNNGSVAFVGYGSRFTQGGIYTNLGGSLNVVADYNTPIPGRGGNFNKSSFFGLSFNNGNIAFETDGIDPRFTFQGIYTNLGGSLTKVIDDEDSLDGKTIRTLSFSKEGLSGNQIAFSAVFSDNSRGIYIATLEPTSIPESSTTLGILAISALGVPSILRKKQYSV